MERYFAFVAHHPVLTGTFFVLLILLLILEFRRGGKSVDVQGAITLINHHQARVVDLRKPSEFATGHILHAQNIPLAELEEKMSRLQNLHQQQIIVVCQNGYSSRQGCEQLCQAGYNAQRLNGGILEWQAQHLPLHRK